MASDAATKAAAAASRATSGAKPKYPWYRVIAAYMVHLYTAMGLPIDYYAVHALFVEKDMRLFLVLNCIAVFVDATDGTMARAIDVKKVTPGFDGAMLDNIVDFLTFTFLPAVAIPASGVVRNPQLQLLCAVLAMLSSAYQFCQTSAKTVESFVGFPSYWNIVFWYCAVLKPSDTVVVFTYVLLAVLSFVPIHFIYPSKTKALMPVTVMLGIVWTAMMAAPLVYWDDPWAIQMCKYSFAYVAYYTIASLVLFARGTI